MPKIYRKVELAEAGHVMSGRIEITPQIVEEALDLIASEDEAYFREPLEQAVVRANSSREDK